MPITNMVDYIHVAPNPGELSPTSFAGDLGVSLTGPALYLYDGASWRAIAAASVAPVSAPAVVRSLWQEQTRERRA